MRQETLHIAAMILPGLIAAHGSDDDVLVARAVSMSAKLISAVDAIEPPQEWNSERFDPAVLKRLADERESASAGAIGKEVAADDGLYPLGEGRDTDRYGSAP